MTVVAQILDRLSNISKPQRKFLLTLFMTMLVTRGRRTFLNLSRHSSVDEKTYRRHFRKTFSFAAFNQLSIAQAVPAQHTQLFAQDTSFSAKSGKHTYGLDKFSNGTASTVERGLEVSVISIVALEANQAFALSAQQTPRHLTKTKTEKTAPRIDFYLEHLAATAAYLPATVKYGVFDGFTLNRSSSQASVPWAIRWSANCAQTLICSIFMPESNESVAVAANMPAKFPSLTGAGLSRLLATKHI